MIYQITPENISNISILERIYANTDLNYYWSDNFTEEFYIALANSGFINVSTKQDGEQFLLCEIQKAYAVLDFDDLHLSKAVKRLERNGGFRFLFNTAFSVVIDGIQKSYEDCWMVDKYALLMEQLHKNQTKEFSLISCELFDDKTGKLIAGEIGYFTSNNVYTSLSGFSLKKKEYNNWGKLQLVLLAKYLQNINVRFWNLGHPYMQYKLDLGAKVLQRDEFLKMWYQS